MEVIARATWDGAGVVATTQTFFFFSLNNNNILSFLMFNILIFFFLQVTYVAFLLGMTWQPNSLC